MFAFICFVLTVISGIFAFALPTGPARTSAFVMFIVSLIAFVIFKKNIDNF